VVGSVTLLPGLRAPLRVRIAIGPICRLHGRPEREGIQQRAKQEMRGPARSDLLLEDKEREQPDDLDGVELVEEARKDELRAHELIGRIDLARDASLRRDDVLVEVFEPAARPKRI